MDSIHPDPQLPGQQRKYGIDLENHTVSRRPKLRASIRSPCGLEPHARFHKLRLAICNNFQPLSDSSTEALDGLQNGSCVTMQGISFTLATLEQALAEELHMH